MSLTVISSLLVCLKSSHFNIFIILPAIEVARVTFVFKAVLEILQAKSGCNNNLSALTTVGRSVKQRNVSPIKWIEDCFIDRGKQEDRFLNDGAQPLTAINCYQMAENVMKKKVMQAEYHLQKNICKLRTLSSILFFIQFYSFAQLIVVVTRLSPDLELNFKRNRHLLGWWGLNAVTKWIKLLAVLSLELKL